VGRDGHAGEPANDVQIQMIQRGGEDAHATFAGARLGRGNVRAILDSIEGAVRRNGERAQGLLGVGYI